MINDFIYLPGQIVYPFDFLRKNTASFHYVFKTDEHIIQKIIDKWFNLPWRIGTEAYSMGDIAIISLVNSACSEGNCEFQEVLKGNCTNDKCARNTLFGDNEEPVGYFKFMEVKVTIFLNWLGGETCAFHPYVFCDDGTQVALAREVYGLTSLQGPITAATGSPEKGLEDLSFSAGTYVPQNLDVTEMPPVPVLIKMEGDSIIADQQIWNSGNEFDQGLKKYLSGYSETDGTPYFDQQEIPGLIKYFVGDIDYVSLRQFRGTPSGDNAIYQAIQEYGYKQFEFQKGGVMPGKFNFSFPTQDPVTLRHFPIAQDLGLPLNASTGLCIWTKTHQQFEPTGLVWNGVRIE